MNRNEFNEIGVQKMPLRVCLVQEFWRGGEGRFLI